MGILIWEREKKFVTQDGLQSLRYVENFMKDFVTQMACNQMIERYVSCKG